MRILLSFIALKLSLFAIVSSTSAQTITTIAGNGERGSAGNGVPALQSQLQPKTMAVDAAGNIYILEDDGSTGWVSKVDANGIITTFAGRGSGGQEGAAATDFNLGRLVRDVSVDNVGNVYIKTRSHFRKVDTSGNITTIGGGGNLRTDGIPATDATLSEDGSEVSRFAMDNAGNIYFVIGVRLRKIDTAGIITTVAGNGSAGLSGDGGPATQAELQGANDIAVDNAGNIYMSTGGRIRKVDASGIITTIAGGGSISGEGFPATETHLQGVQSVFTDDTGNVYFADSRQIRLIDSSGIISVVAGTKNSEGFSGDGGAAINAQFRNPFDISADPMGNVYVVDFFNNRIRKITGKSPILNLIGDKSIREGETLSFSASASDPEGDSVSITALDSPTGFSVTGNTLTWTPDFNQAGIHTISVIAEDSRGGRDVESIRITVENVNLPPVFEEIANQTVDEDQQLQFSISASDPDNDSITLTMSDAPPNATLSRNTFTWLTTLDQAGSHIVNFTADDGQGGITTVSVSITVNNVNQPPELIIPRFQGVPEAKEGEEFRLELSANDPDGDTIQFTVSDNPAGSTLSGNTFTWTPGFEETDPIKTVKFSVSDGKGGIDTESVLIFIVNVNRPPLLNPVGNLRVQEGQQLEVVITGSDPENDGLSLDTSDNPQGSTLFSDDFAKWIFRWTPTFEQAGTYTVTFTINDGQGGTDSEIVRITVGNADQNTFPIAVDDTITVGANGRINIPVLQNDSDPNGDQLTVSNVTEGLNSERVLLNSDGTVHYRPNAGFIGKDSFQYTIDDGQGGIATAQVVVTVVSANPRLELSLNQLNFGDVTVEESSTLSLSISVIVYRV